MCAVTGMDRRCCRAAGQISRAGHVAHLLCRALLFMPGKLATADPGNLTPSGLPATKVCLDSGGGEQPAGRAG